jgi:hypothetical protein
VPRHGLAILAQVWQAEDMDPFAIPTSTSGRLVPLSDGTLFPERITSSVIQMGFNPPICEVTLEVRDGRPVMTRFAVTRTSGAELTPSFIHDLNVGEIRDSLVRTITDVAKGNPHASLLAQGDSADGDRAAALARRRRPADAAEMAQVANIIRSNSYDPRKQVARDLHVSERTASRLIEKAKKLLKNEENNNA